MYNCFVFKILSEEKNVGIYATGYLKAVSKLEEEFGKAEYQYIGLAPYGKKARETMKITEYIGYEGGTWLINIP